MKLVLKVLSESLNPTDGQWSMSSWAVQLPRSSWLHQIGGWNQSWIAITSCHLLIGMFAKSVGTKILSKNMDNCLLSYTILVWPQVWTSMYIGPYVVENGCTRRLETFDNLWQGAWFKNRSVMSLPRLNDQFVLGKKWILTCFGLFTVKKVFSPVHEHTKHTLRLAHDCQTCSHCPKHPNSAMTTSKGEHDVQTCRVTEWKEIVYSSFSTLGCTQ